MATRRDRVEEQKRLTERLGLAGGGRSDGCRGARGRDGGDDTPPEEGEGSDDDSRRARRAGDETDRAPAGAGDGIPDPDDQEVRRSDVGEPDPRKTAGGAIGRDDS